MKIDLNYIKTLNPCVSGWKNLIKHYPNYEGTVQDFLTLEDIPYADRVWLMQKVVPLEILSQWAVECVEGVLYIFEAKYPGNFKVRDCIEATKDYLEGKCSREVLLEKRRNLPYVYSEAVAALDLEAAAVAAARYATNAAVYAGGNKEDHQNLNLSILIELINNRGA